MQKFTTMKIILSGILLCLMGTVCVAVPGITPYITDGAGAYVYYRDYTFTRESYIGILAYDEATYAMRYFAPTDKKRRLPEQDIIIYFTASNAGGKFTLTGERITALVSAESIDIVNYLHDLAYEFAARRTADGDVSPRNTAIFGKKYAETGRTVPQEFIQFGGSVSVTYDFLVPIFNIKRIVAVDGTVQFALVTMGRLRTAEDTSFTAFKGPAQPQKKRKWKEPKNPEIKTYATQDGQQITIDGAWAQTMDNLWLLGDEAVLSMVTLSAVDERSVMQLLRTLLYSNENAYIHIGDVQALYENGSFTVNTISYQPDSNAVTRNFRIITPRKNGSFGMLTLTVFNAVYEAHHAYFDTVIASYRAE